MSERRGDWLQTYSGRAFWPLDPRVEEIDVRDIAHALSLLCRYGGHVTRFYSVAEHCAHAADALAGEPIETQLWALLHDAAEAYLVDLPRPVKRSVVGYAEIERRLELLIAAVFDLPPDIPAIVKRVDNALLSDESAALMVPPPRDWCLPEPPLGVAIRCWSPVVAECEFLVRFNRLQAARRRGACCEAPAQTLREAGAL